MNDDVREQFIRKIYQLDEIYEDYLENDGVDEDTFVARVFKGWIDNPTLQGNYIYYRTTTMFWNMLKPLIDLCEKLNCEMDIYGTKEYQYFSIEIKEKSD